LSSEQTYVLRNANVDMSEIDYVKDFNRMKFGGNHLAIASGNGSYIGYKQIDLTGVAEIGFRISAPAQLNAAGGIVEIHLDSPTGPIIGSSNKVEPNAPSAGFAPPPPTLVTIKPTTGVHDIYYVTKNDKAAAGQSLFVISGIMYHADVTPNTGASSGAAPAAPAASKLDQYAGKYKMTGLPFENIEISVKEGKLMVMAGTQGGELTPLADPDKFDAGGQATFEFVRDGQGKVVSIKLGAMGASFEGQKMNP
jgi:cytochrome c